MVITIKFNLEIIQIDIVNAFIYYNLNKVVYIRLLLGFTKGKIDKVLRLRKALYRLRRLLLLWQKNLISLLNELGFKEVS